MKKIGIIAEKHIGNDGRWRMSLKDDPTEYMGAAVVKGSIPESDRVELFGDFPDDFARPGHSLPYFLFTEVCAPS
jgi:hypothetical protein